MAQAKDIIYGDITEVNPDESQPVIIKLASTQNNWRLMGATKANPDVYHTQDGFGAHRLLATDILHRAVDQAPPPIRLRGCGLTRARFVPGKLVRGGRGAGTRRTPDALRSPPEDDWTI